MEGGESRLARSQQRTDSLSAGGALVAAAREKFRSMRLPSLRDVKECQEGPEGDLAHRSGGAMVLSIELTLGTPTQ